MGYRLTIKDLGNPQIEFTGTKLYGYCDTQELLSFQYLKEIGKFTEEMELEIGNEENRITLNAIQFKIFISLYNRDVVNNKGMPLTDYIGRANLKEIIHSKNDKELWWE